MKAAYEADPALSANGSRWWRVQRGGAEHQRLAVGLMLLLVKFLDVTPENRHRVNEIFAGEEAQYWVHYNSYWEKNAAVLPDIEFKLIMVDGEAEPVGVIAYGQYFIDEALTERKPGAGEVIHLVIDVAHQGKGYGRQAVTQAVALLQEEYASIVIAHNPENAAAKRLFEGMGFIQIGRNYDDDPLLELRTPTAPRVP